MDQHQQVIGSKKHFLELNSNDYPYGEPSCIQFLWERNTKWGIQIKVEGAWNQANGRVHDEFLMDRIVEKVKTPHILARINDVRLFLKVSWLSDIATDDGRNIQEWAMFGPPLQVRFTMAQTTQTITIQYETMERYDPESISRH